MNSEAKGPLEHGVYLTPSDWEMVINSLMRLNQIHTCVARFVGENMPADTCRDHASLVAAITNIKNQLPLEEERSETRALR